MSFARSITRDLPPKIGIVIGTLVIWELYRRISKRRIFGNERNGPSGTSSEAADELVASNGHLHQRTLPEVIYEEQLENFVAAANYALESAFPQQQTTGPLRYSQVSVLLIQWEEDDLGVEAEIDALQYVFEYKYGYDCAVFAIPENNPIGALSTRIEQFIKCANEEDLLIVYYGGHSDQSNKIHSVWRSKRSPDSARVVWGHIQAFLLDCPADVLILLDTCYAGRGGQNAAGETKGSNEVVAASNESDPVPGVGRFSFTSNLVLALGDFAERHRTKNEHLTAVWLCTHLQNHQYPNRLEKKPHYFSLANYRTQSCTIVPLQNSSYRFLSPLVPLTPPDPGPHRVIIAINLRDTPTGDVVSWLQGQGAPAGYITGVSLIQIEELRQSSSSVLLVSFPPAVWLLLSPKIACTFVGLVQSDDLLHTEKRIHEVSDIQVEEENVTSSDRESSQREDLPPPYDEKLFNLSREEFDREVRRQNEFIKLRDTRDPKAQLLRRFEQSYQYSPLSERELRLVLLLPGRAGEPLRGKFTVFNFDNLPPYSALSYVWGPPNEANQAPEWISMEDAIIELRPNLVSAIRAIRHQEESLYLWVDALCINQSDDMERAQQVSFMPLIYHRSQQVIVWLGESTEYGSLAFHVANWIAKYPDQLLRVSADELKSLLTAFFDLMKNFWFRRKWIIADFVFAKEVQLRFGEDVLPWNILAEAISVIKFHVLNLLQIFHPTSKYPGDFIAFLADFEFQAAIGHINIRAEFQRELTYPYYLAPGNTLQSLVVRTALLEASAAIDAVYAMCTIARVRVASKSLVIRYESTSDLDDTHRPDFAGNIPPVKSRDSSPLAPSPLAPRAWVQITPPGLIAEVDYSMPLDSALIQFVANSIFYSRRLDLICRPWAPDVESLPSWVCTKRQHAFTVLEDGRYSRKNADNLTGLSPTGLIPYMASGSHFILEQDNVHSLFHGPNHSLTVQGFTLGEVGKQTPPAISGIIPKQWRQFATSSETDTDMDSTEKFWRILVADRGPGGISCPSWYGAASHYVFRAADYDIDINTRTMLLANPPRIVMDFLKRVESVVWGRKLVKTLTGEHLALVPNNCEPGDLICILFGSSVPVILRAKSSSPSLRVLEDGDQLSTFVLIGECYVHGIMDGEAAGIHDRSSSAMQNFILV